MRVNIRGVFECSRAVAPLMRQQKYGKIVNIASGTVFKGTPMLMHYVLESRRCRHDALHGARNGQ
jgi:short-subunit dehydrogenase